jgi:hypothetical protein
LGTPEEKNHLKNLDVDGRIIMKCTLKKCDDEVWTLFIWLSICGQGVVTSECGNEPSGSIKCEEFFEQLLKKESGPWSYSVKYIR